MQHFYRLGIVIIASLFLLACERNNPVEFRVWMNAGKDRTTQQWDSIFMRLSDAGITGVLLGADTSTLRKAILAANPYDIEIHVWVWAMNRGDADSAWLSYNQEGYSLAEKRAYVNYYKFMCPALPEVKTHLIKKMDELCSVEGLAGIHLDYIRYVDVILPIGLQPKYNLVQDHIMPEFDYGYHPYMRKLYKEQYGTDPLEEDDFAHSERWLQFRLDRLNETVWQIRDHVRSKGLKISAAVFPTPEMATQMVRQQWDRWDLDAYFPMVYHNFYNESFDWIRNVSETNRKVIEYDIPVHCGLFVPSLKEGDDLTKAIDAALAGGASGISLFSYGSLDDSLLKQLKQYN